MKMIRSTLLLLASSIIIFNTSCKKKEDVPKNEIPSWVDYEGYANMSFEANGSVYAFYDEEVFPEFFAPKNNDYNMVKIAVKDYYRGVAMEIAIYKHIPTGHEYQANDFYNYINDGTYLMQTHNIAIVYSFPFGNGAVPRIVTEGKCYIIENSDTQISGYFMGTTDPRGTIYHISKGYFKLKKVGTSWN